MGLGNCADASRAPTEISWRWPLRFPWSETLCSERMVSESLACEKSYSKKSATAWRVLASSERRLTESLASVVSLKN